MLFAGTLALHGSVDAAVIAALALEMLLLGLSLADWDSGVIPNGFLAAILVVWILTVGFRDNAQQFAVESVISAAIVGFAMVIGTAVVGKIVKSKVSYGPAKLAMCLMLFLGIDGTVIAVVIGILIGIVFALVCRAKKRKMSLAPAVSLAFIAAFLLKDILMLLGVKIPF